MLRLNPKVPQINSSLDGGLYQPSHDVYSLVPITFPATAWNEGDTLKPYEVVFRPQDSDGS